MNFDLALALFWSKKLLAAALLPPLGPLLPIAIGLLLLGRHPRIGRALAWCGVVIALLLMTPASVGWLARGLESSPPVSAAALAPAQAIVVLGGGKRDHAPEYDGETLNRLTLERVRYAARLARSTGLPLLVTGGKTSGEQAEAVLMAAALEDEYGVKVRWIEGAARDTRENARFSAALLQAAGVRTIALVTHAAHMPRSRAAFEAAGLNVVPAPTVWLSGPDDGLALLDFLPNANAAFAGWFAAHEWLGRLAYRLSR